MKRSSENMADLTAKFIDAGITRPEIDDLKNAFKDDPSNRRLFDEYMDIWQASAKASQTGNYNEQAAWQVLKKKLGLSENQLQNRNILNRTRWIWQAAAAAAVIFLLSIGGYLAYQSIIHNGSNPVYTEYYVPFGSRSEVSLPDGSAVWLNAGSKLSFNQHFSRKNRDIMLEGEAYFDVKKGKIPFYVMVTGATVKVLGTAFNVKAYPDEKIIETTVTRGIVQVYDNPGNSTEATRIVLHANQKVSIIKSTVNPSLNTDAVTRLRSDSHPAATITQSQVESYKVDRNIVPEIYTSWKDQRWIIEREELLSLAVKLERRYNVKFVFKDEALKHYVFSGILKDETLEQVMEAIKLTAPIQYQINQKQVILSKNKFYKTNQP